MERIVNKTKIDTAEIVNAAIAIANENIDTAAAEMELKRQGWQPITEAAAKFFDMPYEPAEVTISRYAYAVAVCNAIAKLTGAAVIGQEGKWDFASAETIEASFISYLDRRVNGIRRGFTK